MEDHPLKLKNNLVNEAGEDENLEVPGTPLALNSLPQVHTTNARRTSPPVTPTTPPWRTRLPAQAVTAPKIQLVEALVIKPNSQDYVVYKTR